MIQYGKNRQIDNTVNAKSHRRTRANRHYGNLGTGELSYPVGYKDD